MGFKFGQYFENQLIKNYILLSNVSNQLRSHLNFHNF
jgi:hypothetical protein